MDERLEGLVETPWKSEELKEGLLNAFNKRKGQIVYIIQGICGVVIQAGYMDKDALEYTISSGTPAGSDTREGRMEELPFSALSLTLDCDYDAALIRVDSEGFVARYVEQFSPDPSLFKWDPSNNNRIIAVVQDLNNQILMQAYTDIETYRLAFEERRGIYRKSESGKIWRKGDESGDVQVLDSVFADVKGASVLFRVNQKGKGACHTGKYSCFYNRVL